MEISWLGHSCFQLRGKNVTLITDPFSPQLGHSLGKVNAPIVTISHDHPGHNYAAGVGGNPHIVRGPGEYEISDVLITGVASYHDNKRGQELGRNTIYVIHMDDLIICHLGDLGHTLQEEQLEEVADADILLVPIGATRPRQPKSSARWNPESLYLCITTPRQERHPTPSTNSAARWALKPLTRNQNW